MAENLEQTKGLYVRNTTIIAALVGVVIGAVLCGAVILGIMPSKMIVTAESAMGFDETVEGLQKAIVDANWVVSGVLDVNKSMASKGIEFEPRVKIVQLCSPKHARSVLTSSMAMSAMMPCAVSVWVGDDDKVYVSRMNTGFMAAMLGGDAGRIMGGEVVPAEKAILSGIVKD
ncbi:MAG TPA: DUF302 domain-containing protein [Sedimentisphaerales bacterium]|nr:DUF302 domain-containing protein [Sedimentisphaerales bacterium]